MYVNIVATTLPGDGLITMVLVSLTLDIAVVSLFGANDPECLV